MSAEFLGLKLIDDIETHAKEQGMDFEELCKKAGIGKARCHRIYTDPTRIRFSEIEALAAALGMAVEISASPILKHPDNIIKDHIQYDFHDMTATYQNQHIGVHPLTIDKGTLGILHNMDALYEGMEKKTQNLIVTNLNGYWLGNGPLAFFPCDEEIQEAYGKFLDSHIYGD